MSCDIEFQRERKNYNYAQIGLIGHFQVKLVCIFTAKTWLKEADDIQSKKLFMALIAYMEKHKMILVQKIVEEEVPKKSSLSLLIGFSKFVIEKVQGSRVKVTLLPQMEHHSIRKLGLGKSNFNFLAKNLTCLQGLLRKIGRFWDEKIFFTG